MADPTLQQLLTVQTPLQNFGSLLATLSAPPISFPNTTNWTTGTVPNALLQTFGFAMTDFQQSRFNFAAGGLLDYAALAGDAWLTQHADQVFNNQRFPAVATQVDVVFTDAANQGPFTISAGGAGVSTGPNQPIYRTTNLVNATLPLGGTVTIRVRAPSPGTAFNVPDGSLTFFAAGTLPGVTVSNPGPSSIKVAGTDPESNAALIARCRNKWATLGTGSPVQSYVYWALFSGAGQVGKVKPRVNSDLTDPGLVELYLGSPAGGGVDPAIVDIVQNFIAPVTPSMARTGSRIPETAKCVVHSAIPKTVYIKAQVEVYPEYANPTFRAQMEADVASYQAAFPIGGVQDITATGGFVAASRLYQILLNRSGTSLDPAQDIFNTDLELSINNVDFIRNSDFGIGPFDAVTFDTSNITITAVPRPN